MSNKIKNSIVWASIMLASAYLMNGTEASSQFMILMFMVAGWITTDQLIPKKDQEEAE